MKANVDNPLVKLGEFGQSPWLDTIRRSLVTSGELEEMVERDGLKGVTSNPAIFEKAIAGSTDYAEWQEELRPKKLSASELYETLAVKDIQAAADVMKRVYDATESLDGYVSLEVSPLSGERHRANRRRGTPALESGRARELDDQGSRHGGRYTCHRTAHFRGDQCQCDSFVLPICL